MSAGLIIFRDRATQRGTRYEQKLVSATAHQSPDECRDSGFDPHRTTTEMNGAQAGLGQLGDFITRQSPFRADYQGDRLMYIGRTWLRAEWISDQRTGPGDELRQRVFDIRFKERLKL
jgi:hypothetical protein